jgi:polyphosphate glucokinase
MWPCLEERNPQMKTQPRARRVLAVDIGGSHVKVLLSNMKAARGNERRMDSNPTLTPEQMMKGVREMTRDWEFDAVAMGYPGVVAHGQPSVEPHNLGRGWVKFDYVKALGKPVRIINDAAMQAIGSYEGGRMLFLGLGTGLGSAMILNGVIAPMELGHLPYRKERTFEEFVGIAGLTRLGKKQWRVAVFDVVERLRIALEVEYVVLGGGNLAKLKQLPPGTRAGDNSNAFTGGFRLWNEEPWASDLEHATAPSRPRNKSR